MSGKEIMFTPVNLGALHLKNRLVMAPLTRMRAVDGDVPNPLAKTYYAQRASAGLIITEATQISPLGKGYPATPGIYSAEQTAAWKEIVEAVHAKGGAIVAQLWHVGRISHSSLHPEQGVPEAPSAIAAAGQTYGADWKLHDYETPTAMSLEDIARLLKEFEAAAQNAKAAGFDGIEIHSANGYLLDQFLHCLKCKGVSLLQSNLPDCTELMRETYNSKDFREGVNAFLAGRQPRWIGK